MAALTQARSLRFLKALSNSAIDNGTFEGNRIVVKRVADAVLALRQHGWTKVSTLGRATIVARRDGGWPVAVHRNAFDGQVTVEPPVVDNMKDLELIAARMTPTPKMKQLVREWIAAQEAKGADMEVTWNDPSTPQFSGSEFISAPGICISTRDKRFVHVKHLMDAAALSGMKLVAYEQKLDGLTYFDCYFFDASYSH